MDKNKNKKRMMAFFIVAAVLLVWNMIQMGSPKKTIKIACVGDSITYGTGVENREENCYPVRLQNLLEAEKCRVGNFGVNGATLQKNGDKPYWKEERYEQSLSYEPDFVVLMLGTNDTKKANWKDAETFRKDYEEMIASYEKLSTKPQIILATPPSLFQFDENGQGSKTTADSIVEEESRIILEIGEKKEIPVIDMYGITGSHQEWYNADGIHLNGDGAAAFADAVEKEIRAIMEKEQAGEK